MASENGLVPAFGQAPFGHRREKVNGIHINGVEMVHWNADGKIDDFKVMIRPLKAVNLLHQLMKQMLGQMSGGN